MGRSLSLISLIACTSWIAGVTQATAADLPVNFAVPKSGSVVGSSNGTNCKLTALSWVKYSWDAKASRYRGARAMARKPGASWAFVPTGDCVVPCQKARIGQTVILQGEFMASLAPALKRGPIVDGPGQKRVTGVTLRKGGGPKQIRGFGLRHTSSAVRDRTLTLQVESFEVDAETRGTGDVMTLAVGVAAWELTVQLDSPSTRVSSQAAASTGPATLAATATADECPSKGTTTSTTGGIGILDGGRDPCDIGKLFESGKDPTITTTVRPIQCVYTPVGTFKDIFEVLPLLNSGQIKRDDEICVARYAVSLSIGPSTVFSSFYTQIVNGVCNDVIEGIGARRIEYGISITIAVQQSECKTACELLACLAPVACAAKLVVPTAGCVDETGRPSIVAGGIVGGPHELSFSVDAPKNKSFKVKVSGPAETKGPVLQFGAAVSTPNGDLQLSGPQTGVIRSGDRTGPAFVILEDSCSGSLSTTQVAIVPGEIRLTPSVPASDPCTGPVALPTVEVARRGCGVGLDGHQMELVIEDVVPSGMQPVLTPLPVPVLTPLLFSSVSAGNTIGVDFAGAERFTLRALDRSLSQLNQPPGASTVMVAPPVVIPQCERETNTECSWTGSINDATTAELLGGSLSSTGQPRGTELWLPNSFTSAPAKPCPIGGNGCKSCEKKPDCLAKSGDPVYLGSGELEETATDVSWSIPGGTLLFGRTYLSGRQQPGPFGVGWVHTLERSVVDRGSLGVEEVHASGSRIVFPRNADGTYASSGDGGALLSREVGGEWVVQYRSGSAARYRADGRLLALADTNGNTTTLVYAAAGHLTRVVDPVGESLELEVTDGLIRSATAKNGDAVRYAYTDRRLAVVISSAGHSVSYGYGAASGLLESILWATGERQQFTYGPDRRVTRVVITTSGGRDSVTEYAYPDALTRRFTDPTGAAYTFKLDARGRILERIDPGGATWSTTRDALGRPLSRTDSLGHVESWTYGTDGRLLSHRSPGGAVTRIERDPATGFPTVIVHPDGAREVRQFDAAGNLVSHSDPLGRKTTYSHNARGQVVSILAPGGAETRYEYDPHGQLTKTIDAIGQVTTYQRDAAGREVAVTTPGGRTTRTEYCTCGSVSASIDAEGNRTEYKYDAMGALIETKLANGAKTTNTYTRVNGLDLVSEVKDALGNVSKTEYDSSGRVVAAVDVLDRRTTFTRDTLGRVVRVDLPGGNFVLTRYNAAGLVDQTKNALGAATSFVHDANNRVVETIYDDGSTTKQKFDRNGRVEERTNAEGGKARTVFDKAGRVVATIDELGHVNRIKYSDPRGTVENTTNARDKVTRFEYDQLDRIVKTVDALGNSSRQEFGPDGEVTLTVNARGAPTRFKFDRNGRLVETTDAAGGKVKKRFDSVGNLDRVEDELQHAWTFKHDELKRRVRETDPLGRSTHYTFNAAELVKVLHADRSEWHYIHDPASGRLISRVLKKPDGTIEDIESFSYDILGNRIRAENGAVKVTSAFDEMDREVKRTTLYKRTGAVRELRFTWDSMGRRQEMGDSHGRITRYKYDPLSRPVKITVLEPNPRSTSIADAHFSREYLFKWDAINLVQVDYPNGTRTRREHDDIDRLTKLVHERVREGGSAELLASWEIKRDPNGNPERIVRENGEEWKFEHDKLDRLVTAHLPRELVARLRAKDPAKGGGKRERDDDRDDDEEGCEKLLAASGEVEYHYDAAHNRKEEIYGGRSVMSTFDDANRMLTRGSMSFKYNDRGDQTEKIHKSGRRELFGYSSAGKLASYATGHTNSRKLKEIERYLYAPGGDRVLVEDVKGKKLQHALWDGHRQIEEWHEIGHGRGKKEKGHLYTRDLGGQLLEQARFTRREKRTSHSVEKDDDDGDGDDDEGDGDDRGGRGGGRRRPKLNHVRFVHPDFLGSDSVVTNHRGRVLDRREFAPFGVPLAGNFKQMPFGYTGHRAEAQTGHWSAKYRQLDPRLGRWAQRDPLGSVDGQNRYRYARNMPVSSTDPTGLATLIGDAPEWAKEGIDELQREVDQPYETSCKQFQGCKVCRSCFYGFLLSSQSLIIDFSGIGCAEPGLYAYVEKDKPIIRFCSSMKAAGKAKFKKVLLHELTHICTIANLNGAGRVGYWQEPFRWMVFVRGDTMDDVSDAWAGKKPCDPCPKPPRPPLEVIEH